MNVARLPAGYRTILIMDFVRDRRQMKAVALLSAALLALSLVRGCIACPPAFALSDIPRNWPLIAAACALSVAYIPLHELTHGVFMRALGGVRPKYGLKLPYAYAGSSVWFDRRSHMVIALAPVMIWGAALLAAEMTAPREWFWVFHVVQLSNISGSAGDIYCVWRLARLPKDLLVQDTGTRMRVCGRPEVAPAGLPGARGRG